MGSRIASDWVADYLKGMPSAVREITALAHAGVTIGLITYGEI
jgi:hypothetical protein